MFKKLIGVITLALCFIATSSTVSAETDQPYTIRPVLPSNQDSGVTDYISVSTSGTSLKQDMEFLVTNNTGKSMTLKVGAFNALTSPSGSIQYKPVLEENNSKIMKKDYQFKNYVDVPSSVTIDAGMSKVVKATVSIENVEGTVLGVVAFQNVIEGTAKSSDNTQFKLDNKVNNVFGVQVNFPTSKDMEFIIGDAYLDPMPTYYAIRLPITLDTPKLVKGVSIDYVVKDAEMNELFKGKGLTSLDFAPESKANFALPWETEDITRDEEYTVTGKLTYEDKVVEFDKTFVFEGEVESSSTGIDLSTPNVNGFSNWWWLLIIPLALLPLLLLFLMRRNKYILFKEVSSVPAIIGKDDSDYKKLEHISKAKNEDELRYKHYYKRKKIKNDDDEKEIQFKYMKTKDLGIKESDELAS